ncbi:MAG: hypothetical protein ACOWYE_11950 [Desulfatiglandales bacterium]
MGNMEKRVPEKARLLEQMKNAGFNVPGLVYIPAEDLKDGNFEGLEAFFKDYHESFKVVARSAHPVEEFYKGGTFDSLETYADTGGIKYAWKKMVKSARTSKRLSILRQQKFNRAPEIDPEDMGVIVMPYIDGMNVMAKKVGDHWEFGYAGNRNHKVQRDLFITTTPHDIKLLHLSQDIQDYLGFRCEIEYVVGRDGVIHVVQAKDISSIDMLEKKESERSIQLDGIRRIRKRRNYRERTVYVMDNRAFYLTIIEKCENMAHGEGGRETGIEDVLGIISAEEAELEDFALRHQRFGVLGLCIQVPDDLYQIANHYLDETPELQARLSNALNNNQYKIDYFLSEADTLIAAERIRINLCSHDAYGIDTVRNPLWSVYWRGERHEQIVRHFKELGFKTGDSVGIDIDSEDRPTIYRL